jgi:glycosyltransferase involved in cell wall biosynthesis
MQSVFFFQSRIAPFRINLFTELQNRYNFITFASLSKPEEELRLNLLIFKRIKFLGFYFLNFNFFRTVSKYDVIVLEFNIRYCQFLLLKLLFPQKKIVYWGIGVSSDSGYDKSNYILDLVRRLYMLMASEIIFYSDYPKIKYSRYSRLEKKLKVSGNCNLDNVPILESLVKRKNLLFIGTFKKNKGFEEIIELISRIRSSFHDKVIVVGSGTLEFSYKRKIYELNLQDFFEFKGRLDVNHSYDFLMKNCFLTILPSQAGLAVVDSLKMGIPVITKHNAITGGERFYIRDNFNGFLYHDESELDAIVLKLYNDYEYSYYLSNNATRYINSVVSTNQMTETFIHSFKI